MSDKKAFDRKVEEIETFDFDGYKHLLQEERHLVELEPQTLQRALDRFQKTIALKSTGEEPANHSPENAHSDPKAGETGGAPFSLNSSLRSLVQSQMVKGLLIGVVSGAAAGVPVGMKIMQKRESVTSKSSIDNSKGVFEKPELSLPKEEHAGSERKELREASSAPEGMAKESKESVVSGSAVAQQNQSGEFLEEKDPSKVERRLLEAARVALVKGDAQGALSYLEKHKMNYPSGKLAEERDALIVKTLFIRGDSELAASKRTSFLKRYPNSFFKSLVNEDTAQERSP